MRRGCQPPGPFGEAAAFSFYGNKNMTTAEGGAIIARSRSLRETIRRARSHGMTSGTRQRLDSRSPDYDVTMLGFNYRMDELRAAVGLAQLKRLTEWNDIRRRLSLHYRQLIAEHCPSVMVPFTDPWPSAHHLMPVVLPTAISVGRVVIDRLRKRGIQTTVHYPPIHRLTFYNDLYPDCSFAANRGICPTGAHATSPSPDDPGHRRTRREFPRSRTGCGAPGGGNRMTMHDLADQLSGPSLGMHVGLRRALDILCAGVAAVRSRAPHADRGACNMDRKRKTDPVLAASSWSAWTAVPDVQISQIQTRLRQQRMSAYYRGGRPSNSDRPRPRRKQAGRVAATLERSAG